MPSANSPDDIPHVVGNQQRTRLVECHADWPAKGIAVSAEEAGQDIDGLADAIERVETELEGQGRVLVRYSGTQNMCRVMVEGPTVELTDRYAEQIADIVRAAIG